MRSAVEAAGDQSIPPPSSSLRWSSPLPSSLPPPPPIHSTPKSPSPMEVQKSQEIQESEHGSTGMEPGPSSSSPYDTAHKSPPRDLNDVSLDPAESSRATPNLLNEGDDPQPSTSRSHSHFVEGSNPSKLLKPKLEPLDEESSRDGFTPLDALAQIKTESGLGRFSEMRSEDSRSEVSNVEAKRYRVSFKVCSKAAARLKRILNSQPMALKKIGIAGVQVDQSGRMVSVASRAKERAAEEATRRPDPLNSGSIPTPAAPSQPQMRVVADRNIDGGGMMVACGMNAHPPGYSSQPAHSQCHPVMHPGHMGVGQVNIPHSQIGDGPSGSGGVPMGAMPPSSLPPHMQQQRQTQPPPTNSPILVNLLNSQQPPPAVGGRPFSPYAPGYPGGPPGGSGSAPPSAQPQPGQAMDQSIAAYHHHQMQERQRMMMQQQQQPQHPQQQQIQQQGSAPTTPGSGPGPSGYGYPQRPIYPGPQPGMYPQAQPNSQQRVPYPGQPAMYPTIPQVKQEPGTAGYGMPQVKQEPVEAAPPPPKKRKKPTKKQQKEAEAAAASQAVAAQPGQFFSDGRMIHPQQMQGGFPGGSYPQYLPGAGPPQSGAAHPQYPPGAGPHQSGMSAQYYQQQNQQQMYMQQQMQHRMMQQQQQQQQHHMGMGPDYPSGTHATLPSGPSTPWHPHQRPPPVPYPPGQIDGATAGVSGATGAGEMASHSDSNSPVTPFGAHSIMVQQQQQQQQPGHASHASPMYGRESGGGTPTLFPYPSSSHGGSAPSGQSGINSTPLTPGTTPQTPVGHHQSLNNDHHDFDVKLLGECTLDDLNLGDLDDIVPMGDLMMRGGDGGEGAVKEEGEEENGDGGGGTSSSSIKKNGKHDLDMSINSVVDMVAKGGGELSSPTPPSTATPTGGGNGASAFPVTTPAANSSSTAPPTPTQQTPPIPTIRRKNTSSSVQQLTAQQRVQQQQMMGGGQYGSHFGMPPGGLAPQGGMPPGGLAPQGGMGTMHNHPMVHGPPHGLHHPHLPSGHSLEHYSRTLPPSYNHPSRGGRAGGATENGRINGHPEMSNGSGSREDREAESVTDPSILSLLNKVKAQKQNEALAKEQQRTNTSGRGRGGAGSRKKRPAKEIAKERSPKEEEDAFLMGMDGLRGPSTMTAGQAAKARMGVGQGGGGIPQGASSYYHPISTQNHPMRTQPPPVQNKPT